MRDTVFYDGNCGLCHRSVLFLLGHDRDGSRFAFAPLHGETFDSIVSAGQRDTLPDSMVVLTDKGELLTRSLAATHLLRRLGVVWRVLSAFIRLMPTRWTDAAYDAVAKRRRRWFRTPAQACPIVPEPMRGRFLP